MRVTHRFDVAGPAAGQGIARHFQIEATFLVPDAGTAPPIDAIVGTAEGIAAKPMTLEALTETLAAFLMAQTLTLICPQGDVETEVVWTATDQA